MRLSTPLHLPYVCGRRPRRRRISAVEWPAGLLRLRSTGWKGDGGVACSWVMLVGTVMAGGPLICSGAVVLY